MMAANPGVKRAPGDGDDSCQQGGDACGVERGVGVPGFEEYW